MNLFYDYIEPG